MRVWPFGKPKATPYAISRSFYLSVLSSKSQLPLILEVLNPQGASGAVEGFGAPLKKDATKEALGRPLERGAYVLTTKDRKTVLKLLVLSRDEAFFDTDAIAANAHALGLEDEVVHRIRATWTLLQLTFEAYDPAVAPALDFLLSVATRLAYLTEGVVADPICRRYSMPEDVRSQTAVASVVADDHVLTESASDGLCFTLGMQKFELPELVIAGVEPEYEPLAREMLLATSQHCLDGNLVHAGDLIGVAPLTFIARELPAAGRWEGVHALSLMPSASSVGEALVAWQASIR